MTTFQRKQSSLSPTELEKKRKTIIAEEEEKIDVMGQESEKKAKKWVIEVNRDVEKKEKKKEEVILDKLDDSKKQVKTYTQEILYSLHNMILEIGMPPTYQWGVWFDGKGVRVSIMDKYNKRHTRAFMLTRDPKFDLNAVFKFAVWVEDVYDACEGRLQESSPIWTPNQKAKVS